MTGAKLVRAVEGICRGRGLKWQVLYPLQQSEVADGWHTLTAWGKGKRATLRLHADWLDRPDHLSAEVVRQLKEGA